MLPIARVRSYHGPTFVLLEMLGISIMADFTRNKDTVIGAPSALDGPLDDIPDERLIDLIFHEYRNYLYTITNRKIAAARLSQDEADDCFAYVMMKLCEDGCRRIRCFQRKSSFKTYLTVTCSRLIIDYVRTAISRERHLKRGRDPLDERAAVAEGAAMSGLGNPEKQFLNSERERLMREAVARVNEAAKGLPPLERAVFHFKMREGLTYREINAALGVANAAYLFYQAMEMIENSFDEKNKRAIRELMTED